MGVWQRLHAILVIAITSPKSSSLLGLEVLLLLGIGYWLRAMNLKHYITKTMAKPPSLTDRDISKIDGESLLLVEKIGSSADKRILKTLFSAAA
jgi:hypothetical protein